MCTPTTSPTVNHEPLASPVAVCSSMIWVTRHSKVTGAAATRGALTSSEATASSPAASNSSTSSVVEVAFICSASERVARFQVNSRVASALATVPFQPLLENPTSGGV